jgi:hypothetical protein
MNAASTRPTLPSWFVDQVLALPREAVAELDAVGVGRLVAIRAAALGGMSPTRIPQALGISGQAFRLWRASIPAQDDGRGARHYLVPPRGRPKRPTPTDVVAIQNFVMNSTTPSMESLELST